MGTPNNHEMECHCRFGQPCGYVSLAVGIKLDTADFQEHVILDRKTGVVRHILFTPEDPAEFKRILDERVRQFREHPLLLYSLAHALVIPNWLAGPSNVIAFAILLALRVEAEERMMRDEFGDQYAAYAARTKRSSRACGKTRAGYTLQRTAAGHHGCNVSACASSSASF